MRELTRNLLCAAILAMALSATATNACGQALGDPDLTTMQTLRDLYGWGAVLGWQTGANTCGPNPCSDNPCPAGASSWPGVSCDQGRVVVLNLVCGATPLNAPIPPILAQLTGVTSLDIRGCGLTGAIPDLSGLNQLTRIRFNDNLLSGSVPAYLATLPTLGVLDLTNNRLTGTLPNFTQSPTAILLRFGGNLLTVSPPAWSQQNPPGRYNGNVYTDVSYNCWPTPPVAICNPLSPSTNVCTPNRQDCPATVALAKVSGDGQRTQVNAFFTSPLVVSVTDLLGNPVAGAMVTFSGPGIVTATAPTNGSGLASEMVQANSTVGGNTVTASVNSNEMVTFGLTAGTATTCGTDIVVTSNLDSGPGTLRQALADVCPGGTVDLSGIAGQTIALSYGSASYNFEGRLYIATDVTILGRGVTISGSGATRIFFVQGGNVTLTSLTLANGLGQGGSSNFGGSAAGLGGAIFQNGGSLTLSGVTLSGNGAVGGTQDSSGTAVGGGFGAGSSGGDLGGTVGLGDGAGGVSDILGGTGGFGAGGGSATGTLGTGVMYYGGAGGFGGGGGWAVVQSSSTALSVFSGTPGFGGGLVAPEIGGTPVSSGGASGAGFGGAIFVRAGALNLTGVSFTGNSAVGGTGAQGKGGALFLYSGANLNMIPNLTFTGSVAANAGAPGQGYSNPPYNSGATCPGEDTVDVCGTLPTNTLTVTVSGNGSVTDAGGLINCPAGSCSALFQTSAVLTPAAPIGYVFSGWSGGCSGLGACTVSLAAGSVSVLANFVTGAPQAITFNTIPPQLVGTPLTLGATASSGLTVTYSSTTMAVCTVSGSTATFLAPGACSITASQPGSSTYAAASPVTQNFSVLLPQTITFNTIPSQLAGTPLTLTATATSGLTVSYSSTTTTVCAVSGSTATFLASGPCSITASQSGNSTYAAASPVTQNFSVLLSPQTITFNTIPTQLVGTPLTLTATASSGLKVGYSSTTTTVCTVSGSTATFLAPGPCSITASQPGNSTYAAASPVTQNFTVQAAQFMLTTAANPAIGGTVTPPSGSYAANTVVSLTAKPSAGYVFSNWTGSVANPSSASTSITMTGAQSVTANFSAVSTLTVAPSSIDFGTLYQGSIAIKNVTLTNTGTTPITVTDPLLSIVKGGNSSEFVQLNLCPKSLAAGSHCTITITFVAGPVYTPQTATLSITDNAPGSPQTVMLTATVIDPLASFNLSNLSFGTQAVASSTTKAVTLRNAGATPLLLTGMAIAGTNASAFTLTPASNCGSSLTAGSSCTISVTFKPVAKGSYSAALNVTDNAQSGTQVVILSGTGH